MRYLRGLAATNAAKVAITVVAFAFVGGFWLLDTAGVIEPGTTVAVVGVALFLLVAAPVGLLTAKVTDDATRHDR